MHLDCTLNKLKTLDISHNEKLLTLFCTTNELTQINLENNTLLREADCSKNNFNTIDLSNKIPEILEYIDLRENPNLKTIKISKKFKNIATSWYKDKTTSWEVSE